MWMCWACLLGHRGSQSPMLARPRRHPQRRHYLGKNVKRCWLAQRCSLVCCIHHTHYIIRSIALHAQRMRTACVPHTRRTRTVYEHAHCSACAVFSRADALQVSDSVTSDVIKHGEVDWAVEALLLTHEPMRRDMATMNECLEPRFFGALPESWRVRASQTTCAIRSCPSAATTTREAVHL